MREYEQPKFCINTGDENYVHWIAKGEDKSQIIKKILIEYLKYLEGRHWNNIRIPTLAPIRKPSLSREDNIPSWK